MRRKNPKKPKHENEHVASGHYPIEPISVVKKLTTNQVLAFTTVIIALAGIWQGWVARDTEKRQLRAYISIEGWFEILRDSTGDSSFHERFTIKNSGQTPAYHFVNWYRNFFKEFNPKPTFDMAFPIGQDTNVVVINPGTSTYLEILQHPTPFDKKAMKQGLGGLYTWGEMTYDDAFGCSHFARFRSVLTLRKEGIYELAVDSHGNESN